MPRAETATEIEEYLCPAIEAADLSFLHRLYWEQNEFVHVERFVPMPVVERCVREVDLLEGDIHRNYVPGHKQGGSVSYYTIRQKAPAILALYRSEVLRSFLNQLIGGEPIEWCPEDDPHSCALYYYTKPGDHIGFHYDISYYKGARYTVLIGLVEQSEHCRLVARVRKGTAPPEISETRITMEPGTMVVFNGDKLWHAVTPLGDHERRVVLTLQYVTDRRMGPLNKLFSNLKDAFAYFGPAVFMPWAKSRERA